MEEKHFKILEFLSKQPEPFSYKDFPPEIQEDFRYRDTPLKEGSLLSELELILNRSKKWLNQFPSHKYSINEEGKNALQRELKIRNETNLIEQKTLEKLSLEIEDLRNKFFDYNDTKARTKRSEIYVAVSIVLPWICNKHG